MNDNKKDKITLEEAAAMVYPQTSDTQNIEPTIWKEITKCGTMEEQIAFIKKFLPSSVQNMYINAVMKENLKGENLETQKTKQPNAAQYVIRPKRNGYVSAVLLTIITFLFGTLCVAYMLTSILGN